MDNEKNAEVNEVAKKKEKRFTRDQIKNITFNAIGIALFVALSMCLRVPVFDNYYLCLGYVVMTVYIWSFKWYDGAIVGFFGVWLYCLVGSLGFNGAPGWALGNVAIGLILGLFLKAIKFFNKGREKTARSRVGMTIAVAIVAIIATFIGIEIIKSAVDSFVVAQPFGVRFVKNFSSFVADAFVIVFSLPICIVVDKVARIARYGTTEE